MIGIFGGTFDPVHYGHLKTVKHVRQQLELEQVRLVPLGQAVHREQPVATAEQRLEMLKAATDISTGMVVDDREINRPGGSYSVDTLHSLKQDFPDKTFCLIIGSDAFAGFPDWHQPDTILTLAHIVVMQRPETVFSSSVEIEQLLKKHAAKEKTALHSREAGYILFQSVPQLDISSTQIRQLIGNGQPVDELLPQAVNKLIRQWQLYRDNTIEQT